MSHIEYIKLFLGFIFDEIEQNIQLAKNSNEAYDENNKKIPCSDLNVAASLRVRFHRDFDSLYLMEDEWLLDIEDRLNSLQDPAEELYRDVSDKIQIFHQNTKDIVELCIKPSDGDQQLIPEYTQLYEKLNMSYEQLIMSYMQIEKTIRETNVQEVDVQKEGKELLFSRKDIMSVFQPELWTLVKQRIKE